VRFQKISIPGRGFQKPTFLKESMTLMEFPKGVGWGEGVKLKTLPWEGNGYFLEQHIKKKRNKGQNLNN